MAIFNMVASGGGGGEIKSEDFSVTTTSRAYITTITTSALPSWYVLVGRGYSYASAGNVVKCVIGLTGQDAGYAYAYTTQLGSSTSSSAVGQTITPTITSAGKLRFEVTGTRNYFYGEYTLYYID